jgi:hypothetical protein
MMCHEFFLDTCAPLAREQIISQLEDWPSISMAGTLTLRPYQGWPWSLNGSPAIHKGHLPQIFNGREPNLGSWAWLLQRSPWLHQNLDYNDYILHTTHCYLTEHIGNTKMLGRQIGLLLRIVKKIFWIYEEQDEVLVSTWIFPVPFICFQTSLHVHPLWSTLGVITELPPFRNIGLWLQILFIVGDSIFVAKNGTGQLSYRKFVLF